MDHTVVIDVVGLTPKLIAKGATHIQKLAQEGSMHKLKTITPAVTCAVQSTFTTGSLPQEHGCVANGWYFRDLAEVWFWRQSNHLVKGEKIWEEAKKRDPKFSCAKLFWWYNMYSSADYSITPRPMYPADGRKIPDIYAYPETLRASLNDQLGIFPLFNFWGPKANIVSSEWIAKAAIKVFEQFKPTLNLIYLPHLDYNLQKLGPDHPQITEDVKAIDKVCGQLIEYFRQREAKVIILSEYGITPVDTPIHINRILRELDLIAIRKEMGREKLDPGASKAFAVSDHQIAHVYIQNPNEISKIKKVLENTPGIDMVLAENDKKEWGLSHPRSGELIAIAAPKHWFTYYYWLDDNCSPDFARTVDIHRKPGYDPVELFIDPKMTLPMLQIAWKLGKKILGFRSLFDVIPLDASLVKGSHGRVTFGEDSPVFITSEKDLISQEEIQATEVKQKILSHIFVT